MATWDKLDVNEQSEICEFAVKNGRNWKSKLRQAWERAECLVSIRNKIGPSGLIALRIPGNLCYYVSFGRHARLKCAGQCPDEKHRAFYQPYFRKNGAFSSASAGGPYTVKILPYTTDQIPNPDQPVTA